MRPIACAAALIAGLNGPAQAHPHIFVDAGADFLFDASGRLEALRITWTYDAFTTLFMFDTLDLDRDGDGRLDDADRAAIVLGETDWPPDYDGDVHLDVADIAHDLARPQNGAAELVEDRIVVRFDLPLTAPLEATGLQATLRLYDPGYYYAYSVSGVPSFPAGSPGCQATVIPFEPDASAAKAQAELAALSREETPTEPNVGSLFSDEIRLVCS